MVWSEENSLKLIDAYRKKSLLWDLQHKDRFKKPLKADAWREIGADYGPMQKEGDIFAVFLPREKRIFK